MNLPRMNQAIYDAGLEDFLNSLPEGVDTKVTEVGSNLSGGQLQRIGLARAFYSEAELLVFDEPTSAMDKVTENEIIQNIVEKTKTTSVIVISHQEKFLNYANRAYKVQNGVVLEHPQDV